MDLPAYPKCFTKRSLLRASQSTKDISNQSVKEKIDVHNREFVRQWTSGSSICKADN